MIDQIYDDFVLNMKFRSDHILCGEQSEQNLRENKYFTMYPHSMSCYTFVLFQFLLDFARQNAPVASIATHRRMYHIFLSIFHEFIRKYAPLLHFSL